MCTPNVGGTVKSVDVMAPPAPPEPPAEPGSCVQPLGHQPAASAAAVPAGDSAHVDAHSVKHAPKFNPLEVAATSGGLKQTGRAAKLVVCALCVDTPSGCGPSP
jgi:hypothetical protein